MRHLLYFLLFILIFSCGKKITYTVTRSDAGYGYEIFISGKKVIDQPHLPGISAIRGFSDSGSAAITAEYIIQKIKNGQWPPSIGMRELDSLGVLGE